MPVLQLEDGSILNDLEAIDQELNALLVDFRHFDPGTTLLFPDLDQQDVLDDDERQNILDLHDCHFEFLRLEQGYLWHDLLVLHPGSPNLYTLATQYNRCHTHTAPEALYVLSGAAIYGFIRSDGSPMRLLVQPQDYIHIPAGVEHWFRPTASLHFKAVRYFSTPSGWVPRYTGTMLNDTFYQE